MLKSSTWRRAGTPIVLNNCTTWINLCTADIIYSNIARQETKKILQIEITRQFIMINSPLQDVTNSNLAGSVSRKINKKVNDSSNLTEQMLPHEQTILYLRFHKKYLETVHKIFSKLILLWVLTSQILLQRPHHF